MEDSCLAAQNLMLAARDEGIGSCWIGFGRAWLNLPSTKKELALADNCHAVAPIVPGYPKMWPESHGRKPPGDPLVLTRAADETGEGPRGNGVIGVLLHRLPGAGLPAGNGKHPLLTKEGEVHLARRMERSTLGRGKCFPASGAAYGNGHL